MTRSSAGPGPPRLPRLTRRQLLHAGGVALLAAGSSGWRLPAARAATRARDPLLVVVFLRGGADGLHLVPPTGDAAYTRLRGALAVADPLRFAPGFGLHPELAPLAPLLERGELAAVHAAGSPAATRSHFEAQDWMELGVVAHGRTADGWLARALAPTLAHTGSSFAAVALGSELPLALRGSGGLALGDPAGLAARFGAEHGQRVLAGLYAGGDDPVRVAGRRALAAASELADRLPRDAGRPARARRGARARRRRGLAGQVATLGALLDGGLPVRAAWLESSGWDSHAGQLRGGALQAALRDLAAALPPLADRLRQRGGTALVLTEFGRTVRVNGSGGSDHGHGSVSFLLGPRVRAGVHGAWPGLGALHEDRDLPVANDWRDIATEIVRAELGAPPPGTFPGFAAGGELGLLRRV